MEENPPTKSNGKVTSLATPNSCLFINFCSGLLRQQRNETQTSPSCEIHCILCIYFLYI